MTHADNPFLEKVRQTAEAHQRRAADPAASAWVSANAGTGKTHVLVMRVLRLLLAGTEAQGILCLTFTKAAAAEMSNRLIRELARWAAMPEEGLAAGLRRLLEREPTAAERDFARCLFARVLDAPGGLKIMTIHAFCDRVLRRFPLEAAVPPGFTILTDEERRAALSEASDAVLGEAADEPDGKLGRALKVAVAHATEDKFGSLLQAALGQWGEFGRAIHRQFDDGDPFDALEARLRAMMGVAPGDTAETLAEAMAAVASQPLLESAIAILSGGKTTDTSIADALKAARGQGQAGRITAFAEAFLTDKGTPRADSRFITKAIREANPGLAAELREARDTFASLELRRRALATATASAALMRLADAVIQHYEDAKLRANALDFDALIAKTAALFNRSDAAAWVLYRLDADLTHILVDEAQDTSPAQWALIRALTGEFFTGESAEARRRTLFAVGDEKQSIYSFQGAEPRRFAEAGRDFGGRAKAAGETWHVTPLTLSFRSTRAVLEAVDLVFADHGRTPGLGLNGGEVRHTAHRDGEAGIVEVWPVMKAAERTASPVWEPFAEEAASAPAEVQLANRIARQIRHWLDSGEMLASQNRPIRAGDILILVRKRAPLAMPIVKALKDHGIPVAGADRLRLNEQLAVMDLMVIGDTLLLPQDDLALATALKSPAIGFDDDDLFAIAFERPGTLWDALAAHAGDDPRYAGAVARLNRWREAAAAARPFEFYSDLLDGEAGLRKTLIARLGPEAADALDEFLNLALEYEAANPPSLQGFLHWLRIAAPEIKRDMEQGRGEVRVMTVHGAKGLEASIVFLADTTGRGGQRVGLITVPDAGPAGVPLPVWPLPGSSLVPQIAEAQDAIKAAEREEYHRLLYVAMTRARDRLYVAGYEGEKARPKDCWYELISGGMGDRLEAGEDNFGEPARHLTCPQTVPAKTKDTDVAAAVPQPLPPWAVARAPQEARGSHVSPSRLVTRQPARPGGSAAEAPEASSDEALLRGRLVHRLLELLPGVLPGQRQAAGERFLGVEAATLDAGRRAALLADVLRILEAPRFGAVFGPGSRAEVPVVAELPAAGGGAPLVISGQIDRLIVTQSEIVALDFKTGAFVPARPDLIPPAYVAQMAGYRLVLSRLFPGKPLRAALLWTSTPSLMEISSPALEAAEQLLLAT